MADLSPGLQTRHLSLDSHETSHSESQDLLKIVHELHHSKPKHTEVSKKQSDGIYIKIKAKVGTCVQRLQGEYKKLVTPSLGRPTEQL